MSDNAIDLKIRRCADILRSGGVVVCPTEGIYGLSAAADHDDAILRIIDIKRRDPNKGLIMVGSSFEMVRKYIDVSAIAPDTFRQMLCTWPGHHTWVVPCTSLVSLHLTGNRKTIAVRVSPFNILQRLCEYTQSPLVSTSANISGSSPIDNIGALHDTFGDLVDYILDEPCGRAKKPSTIHDSLSGRILRP